MSEGYVGRGGQKLEAAIRAFGLDPQIAGAQAIDVGASTGGFTDCLLEHGASRVVAVDVGHGQLHERLRKDPRVELHERVHFKHLALTELAGPYDFFTVDVSFVAARTMLRPLAFRLREGAHGVVLVKPQFELPEGYVRRGKVEVEGLREWALKRVAERGRGLGFELVEAIDSPVPGGEGTVEILAHLVLARRGEKMPERAPEGASTSRSTSTSRKAEGASASRSTSRKAEGGTSTLYVVCAPGLEGGVEEELGRLGLEPTAREAGGVTVAGDREALARIHLTSRMATRVLVRVGELDAKGFADLVERARRLPWERYYRRELGAVLREDRTQGETLRVSVTARGSRLFHTGAIAERLRRAVGERLERHGREGGSDEVEPSTLYARGVDNHWTLSVDASGELLHRRGYRQESTKAPLRETLAAGILGLAGWDPSEPLVDPMCGSGTLAIEACRLALGIAPGTDRPFAFFGWPGFDAGAHAALVEELVRARRAKLPSPILAADRSAGAVAATQRNAERAQVAEHLTLRCLPLDQLEPPSGLPGLVVVNPPYGVRLEAGGGGARARRGYFAQLGATLRARFPGWRLAVVVPEASLATVVDRRATVHPLAHGGLRVSLALVRPD